ncbi:kinase A anchor protein [Phlyctochytrium arcticum]|nr:kinase A anchor protein [Phlyctochytrium arcticum]
MSWRQSARPNFHQRGKSHRPRRPQRPNHFLSLRLDDSKLQAELKAFYQYVHITHPNSRPFLIAPEQSHITLLLMHLDSQASIDTAIDSLESAGKALESLIPPLPELTFRGVGTFSNGRVIYSKPVEDGGMRTLRSVVEVLTRTYAHAGCNLVGNRPYWNPHCTLMKSQDVETASIDAGVWEPFMDHAWGTSVVDKIELCSMLAPKAADGYYATLASLDL